MSRDGNWGEILLAAERQHSFMDMLCTAAADNYCAKGEIFCRKGCAGCCTLAVNCTAAEASLVATALDEQQKKSLASYVEKLKCNISGIDNLKGYLRLHRQELGGCPFLHEKSCGVYAARPISCRALLATRESRWCSTDFSLLTSEEKKAYLDSLDPAVVALPMHYLASPQEAGRQLELQSALLLLQKYGFSLYGNLPALVYLFTHCNLSESLDKGAAAVLDLAAAAGLDNPFVIQVEKL